MFFAFHVSELLSYVNVAYPHPFVAGNRFEFGVVRGLEWTSAFPGIFDGSDDPEAALGIAHDPMFGTGAIHEQGCLAVGCGDHRSSLLVCLPIEAILVDFTLPSE